MGNMNRTGLSKLPVFGWNAERLNWWGYRGFGKGLFSLKVAVGIEVSVYGQFGYSFLKEVKRYFKKSMVWKIWLSLGLVNG